MSHVLQYVVGFQRLGHDIVFVEKAGYPRSCFDPLRDEMSDDCAYGTAKAHALLRRFELGDRWCFVDSGGRYHGLDRRKVEKVFSDADVFIDMGTHGAWLEEAQQSGLRVMIDGEPGYNQIKMKEGNLDPDFSYDYYFTNGRNIGTSRSSAPTAGRTWHHLFHPVVPDLFQGSTPANGDAFTTVMNWRSHDPIDYRGTQFGQKDIEFEKFFELPVKVDARMELAVSGSVPRHRLQQFGWNLLDGHATTLTFDSFRKYIATSAAEFSVAKNVFVALNTGWFSDRSAAYLAAGRPVIMQETGFSDHLPTGRGLFAVSSLEQAVEAVRNICANPLEHSNAATHLANTYLDSLRVLRDMLDTIGVDSPANRCG